MRVENLSIKYKNVEIFKNLSFEVQEGDIVGIQGENGCGKTSLCLALCGLIENSDDVFISGKITYSGKCVEDLTVAERCREVGIIFQNPENQLFSSLCLEELAFALENLCIPREEMQNKIDEVLGNLNLTYLATKKTNELSGGEKQLIAICSLLIMQPKLLICDEITSHIDIANKKKIRQVLKDYANCGGSVIVVSHNPNDLAIADKILILEKGKDYSFKG